MSAAPRIAFAIVLILVAAETSPAQRRDANPVQDQMEFFESEPFQVSVPLSADVLRVLLETKAGKQGMEWASKSKRTNAARLFRAAEVHLGGPDEIDFIVIGIPPMGAAADIGWYWVVRRARDNPKVILSVGGDSLELMASRTNGYRDIDISWTIASESCYETYHYDGKKYRLWKKQFKETSY